MHDAGDTEEVTFAERPTPRETFSGDHVKLALLLCELCLIAWVVFLFSIEQSRHLLPLVCITISGFAVHALLPQNRRPRFFAALSIMGVLLILGVANGVRVIGVGALLISICYLPLRMIGRLAILFMAVTALIWFRRQYPLPFWPIVGSMFMFRLVCFLYETRKRDGMPPLTSSLSYFFLLPNVCFPLFPVIDFKTFRDAWYREEEWMTYQRGVHWIVRGLIHLLLYRFIKLYLVPKPYDLRDLPTIAVFMATNYALYLQVSGQFHLITGLLHLFGYDLPRTHNMYFLASSFSDIWRRINIYWKDFMTKFFFYPSFYALRRYNASARVAMLLSVLVVFVSTWLLHSWQTFWLLGQFPLTANDACLWLAAGVVVAANVLLESQRRPRDDLSDWAHALSRSARTVGMFCLVSLFWACWTKPGFLHLLQASLQRNDVTRGLLTVVSGILVLILIGAVGFRYYRQRTLTHSSLTKIEFFPSVKAHVACLALMITVALPRSAEVLPLHWAQSIAHFKEDPALADAAFDQLQSYYEELNSAVVQAGPLISSFSKPDPSRRTQAEGFNKVSRPADAYQQLELIPGIETQIDGHSFSVNQFGMRDLKTVRQQKSHGTIRIALVGSSIVMGYGVSDGDVFSRQLETLLNQDLSDSGRHIEVLNFGVGKQWAPHRLIRIQRRVIAFQPDVLFYFAHQDEFRELASHAAQLVSLGLELPSRYLKEVAAQAHVTSDMAPGAIQSVMHRHEKELLLANYRSIVDECRQHQVIPVWIYVPIPDVSSGEMAKKLIPIASNAGFVVHDLSHWATSTEGLFDKVEEFHPNARGHRMIAEALIRMIKESPETLPMFSKDLGSQPADE